MSGWGAELLGKFGENRPDQKECPSCMLMIDKDATICPACETVQPGCVAQEGKSASAADGWGDFSSAAGSAGTAAAGAPSEWGNSNSSSSSASPSNAATKDPWGTSGTNTESSAASDDPWGTAPSGSGGEKKEGDGQEDDPWGTAPSSSSGEKQGEKSQEDDPWGTGSAAASGAGAAEGEQAEAAEEGLTTEQLHAYFSSRGEELAEAGAADAQVLGAVASLLHTDRSIAAAGELGAGGRLWGWGSGECDQLGMAPPPVEGKEQKGSKGGAAAGGGQNEDEEEEEEEEEEDGDLYLEEAMHVPALQAEHCPQPQVAITAGGMHTVAVLADGSAVSWGCNDEGQLGRRTRGVLPQPIVGFGAPHPMAEQLTAFLGDGSASASGRGSRRGAASSSSSSSGASLQSSADPVDRYMAAAAAHGHLPPLDGFGKVVSVACGDAFTILLDSRGRVYVCGRLKGPEGRFGVSPEVRLMPFPVEVPGVRVHGRVVDVAAGYDHAVFATASGKVLTWGVGHVGQLGRPEAAIRRRSESVLAWEAVVVPLWRREGGRRRKVLAQRVAAGGMSTYVLTRCGRVLATGLNHYGQLGTGGGPNLTRFEEVDALRNRGLVQLAAGTAHFLALSRAGDVLVCGRGDSGQLGLGSAPAEKAPVDAQLPVPRRIPRSRFGGEPVVQVIAGSNVSAAVTRSGRLFAWGFGELAQLGNGQMRDEAVPFDASGAQGGKWGGRAVLQAAVGGQHIFALVSETSVQQEGGAPYDGAKLAAVAAETAESAESAGSAAGSGPQLGRKRGRGGTAQATEAGKSSKRRRR